MEKPSDIYFNRMKVKMAGMVNFLNAVSDYAAYKHREGTPLTVETLQSMCEGAMFATSFLAVHAGTHEEVFKQALHLQSGLDGMDEDDLIKMVVAAVKKAEGKSGKAD